MDNWLLAKLGPTLRSAADPVVVDLGYGATPITTVELASRLARIRADTRVVGVEIDTARVADAQSAADPPRLTFVHGGFELAGRRPTIVRAANVLRQYDEASARAAWITLCASLAPGGAVVEGTCDELGRLGGWVLLDASGPVSLTLSARIESLERPAVLAERLPKALIHHNVAGQRIHALLTDLDRAWHASAALSTFGPRQRWVAACGLLRPDWPVDVTRARFGELTVPWSAVAPEP